MGFNLSTIFRMHASHISPPRGSFSSTKFDSTEDQKLGKFVGAEKLDRECMIKPTAKICQHSQRRMRFVFCYEERRDQAPATAFTTTMCAD